MTSASANRTDDDATSPPSPGRGGSAPQPTGWGGRGRQGRETIQALKRANARRMRNNDTAAEEKLWRALRRLPMEGSHFRRQVPIGNFIADFACLSAKLILEVDGSRHGTPTGVASDAQRTAWLEAEGFKVVRFWNSDITGNIDGVLDRVHAALYGSMNAEPRSLRPPPSTPPRRASRADPPPQGEGGRRAIPSRRKAPKDA